MPVLHAPTRFRKDYIGRFRSTMETLFVSFPARTHGTRLQRGRAAVCANRPDTDGLGQASKRLRPVLTARQVSSVEEAAPEKRHELRLPASLTGSASTVQGLVSEAEAAIDAGQAPRITAIRYADVQRVAKRLARNRRLPECIEFVTNVEKLGIPLRRSISSVITSQLGMSRCISELEGFLTLLWAPNLPQIRPGFQPFALTGAGRKERVPDVAMMVRAVNACVCARRVDAAERVVRQAEEAGMRPNEHLYSILIKGYGRQMRSSDIRNILSKMDEANIRSGIVTLNCTVDAFVRCNAWGDAWNTVLKRFDANGVTPTACSFNPLIRGLVRNNRLEDAFRVRKLMDKRKVAVTAVSLNTLMLGCGRRGQFDSARKLLEEAVALEHMPLQAQEDPQDAFLYRTIDSCISFTTLATCFAEHGHIDDAIACLEDLTRHLGSKGLPETLPERVNEQVAIGAASVISGALKRRDLTRAMSIFQSMEARYHVRPNMNTYATLLRGLARLPISDTVKTIGNKLFDDVCDVYAERVWVSEARPFRKHRSMPSLAMHYRHDRISGLFTSDDIVHIFNVMLQLRVRWEGAKAAEELLRRFVADSSAESETNRGPVRDEGFTPDSTSYTTILSAYGKEGRLDEARRVFVQMRDANVHSDRVAMNALLGACVLAHDRTLAETVFEEMQRVGKHISPNLETFSAMIALYVRDRDLAAAWGMYEELKAVGIVPNERIIDRMMAACVLPPARGKRKVKRTDTNVSEDRDSMVIGEVFPGATGIDADTLPDALNSAVEEFYCETSQTELVDELRAAASTARISGGWSSSRVAILLNDMESSKFSQKTLERWRARLEGVWTPDDKAAASDPVGEPMS